MKGKITSAVNSINALVKDTAGKFDHSQISKTNALATHGKLLANVELIKGLHEIYCVHRERGKDDASEEALLEKDEEYVTEVELKAHKALNKHAEYVSHLQLMRKQRLT